MTLSCKELIPLICAALDTGARVRFTATGSSMFPFLRNGETVEIERVEDGELRPGDVALAERADGSYVLHRIADIRQDRVFMVSDAGNEDGWLPLTSIIARACAVRRNDRWIRLDTAGARRLGLGWTKLHFVGPPLLGVAVRVRARLRGKRAKRARYHGSPN